MPQPANMSTARLRAAAQHIQEQDRADSTNIAQNSRAKPYFQFAKIFNVSESPPDGDQVALYATWLAFTTFSTSDSLRRCLSSLKTFWTRQPTFYPSPTQYPALQTTIDRTARLYAAPSRRSPPITLQILFHLTRTAPPTYPYNSWMSLTILTPPWSDSLIINCLIRCLLTATSSPRGGPRSHPGCSTPSQPWRPPWGSVPSTSPVADEIVCLGPPMTTCVSGPGSLHLTHHTWIITLGCLDQAHHIVRGISQLRGGAGLPRWSEDVLRNDSYSYLTPPPGIIA